MPFAYLYTANQAAICSCQFYKKHNVYFGYMAWKEQELKKSRQLYQKSLKIILKIQKLLRSPPPPPNPQKNNMYV